MDLREFTKHAVSMDWVLKSMRSGLKNREAKWITQGRPADTAFHTARQLHGRMDPGLKKRYAQLSPFEQKHADRAVEYMAQKSEKKKGLLGAANNAFLVSFQRGMGRTLKGLREALDAVGWKGKPKLRVIFKNDKKIDTNPINRIKRFTD